MAAPARGTSHPHPHPHRGGVAAASAPIPIAPRRMGSSGSGGGGSGGGSGGSGGLLGVRGGAGGDMAYLSASVPAAPIIGSLKAPAHMEAGIPHLALPPSLPDSLSLAAVNTEQLNARMVGVSSAPARNFVEHARRTGASVPLPGTSPTLLSTMMKPRAVGDEALARSTGSGGLAAAKPAHAAAAAGSGEAVEFTKMAPPSAGVAPSEGGLSAMLRRGAATGSDSGAGSSSGGDGGVSGGMGALGLGASHTHSLSAPVVLAASFRDGGRLAMVAATLTEVEEEAPSDTDSDSDAPSGRGRLGAAGAVSGRGGVRGDDDDHKAAGDKVDHDDHFFAGEF